MKKHLYKPHAAEYDWWHDGWSMMRRDVGVWRGDVAENIEIMKYIFTHVPEK